MEVKDVVIIGAGPAGIAAAIQLKRYNIEPVLLEQEEVGGLLRNANLIENYPGFPQGVSGLEIVELFKKQLNIHGITVGFEKVLEVRYSDELFFIETKRKEIASNIVVIASGTKPKKFSGISISDDIKKRIFYEIYPIRSINHKKVAIVGAGDAAFDYAMNLSKKNDVIIFNRSNEFKCIPVLRERCFKSDNISYLENVSVIEIKEKGNKILLTFIDNKSLENRQIKVDYVLGAIGREPCLDYLSSDLEHNLETLIKANKLYLIGDVKNGLYRQTAISVGDGLKAAMKIYESLKER